MTSVEKAVFISYRRTNMPWALAIYQNLTAHGYDVFFDYESIASGDFEQIILENIRARAHFLVVLTPSALERCDDPNDWLRREIETAFDEKRNIVPIFLEGFDFSSPSISKHLTGKLENLKKYNGQNIPAGFFDAAMSRVREKFLSVPIDTVLHPVSNTVRNVVQNQQVAASKAAVVKEQELTAQEWFEKARQRDFSDYDERINCCTEAIRLQPNFAEAYLLRGVTRMTKGDRSGAFQDVNKALECDVTNTATYVEAYHMRAALKGVGFGDLDSAIQDMTLAIMSNSLFGTEDPDLYRSRGDLCSANRDYNTAVTDYQKYFDLGGTDEDVRQDLEKAKKKIGKKSFWSFLSD